MAYDWNWLANAYQNAYGAGQQMWPAIQAGYQQRYADVMGGLKGLGASAEEGIRQQFANAAAKGMAGLTARGLGASTITTSMRRGYERDQATALNQLREQLRREQLGYQTSLGGEALAAQERQQAQTPQLNQLLAAQQARSQEQLAQQQFGLETELGRGRLLAEQQRVSQEQQRMAQQYGLAQQQFGLDQQRLAYSMMPGLGQQQQATSGYQLGQGFRIPRAWMGYA